MKRYIRFKKNEDANYYGVDILEGEQPKDLHFVRAMGEHLPFKDGLFDITISGTSILHYVNPTEGIREALRVTKPEGKMCIWLGVKSPETPQPKGSPEWYQELEVPEGAENPFHYKRYAEEEFEEMINNAGGRVAKKEIHPVDEWRKNIFYEVKK